MSAAQLAQVLENMQDWGTSHPEYFMPGAANHQRMIVGPKLMRDIELETASGAISEAPEISPRKQTTDHEQKLQRLENIAEAPTDTMQLNGMKFTRCSEVKHQQSVLEKLQLQVEDYLGEQVDWWPLPPLKRQKKGQHTELEWEVSQRNCFTALRSIWLTLSFSMVASACRLFSMRPRPRS